MKTVLKTSISGLSVFVIVFSCFFQQGTAIKCFECNSHTQPECALAAPPDTLSKNCTDTENKPRTMCRKITQIIEFEVNGLPANSRVIRSCGWDESNYVNKCYHRSGFGGRQEVCSCQSDLCNSASFLNHENIIVALSAVLSAIFAYNHFNARV